jgi:hypothetical protein
LWKLGKHHVYMTNIQVYCVCKEASEEMHK